MKKFDVLENPEDDRKVFFITPPEVYPDLFGLRFPQIVKKSRRKRWELARHGKSSFLSFEATVLSEEETEQVEEWKERFEQYVLIGLNSNIQSNFSDELDFCLALDFNFVEGIPGHRTLYGEAEYHLKYRQNIASLDVLSDGLAKALRELLEMFRPKSSVLSIVPSPPGPSAAANPELIQRGGVPIDGAPTEVPKLDRLLQTINDPPISYQNRMFAFD